MRGLCSDIKKHCNGRRATIEMRLISQNELLGEDDARWQMRDSTIEL